MSKVRFVGMDVHAETITVAVAESGSSEVRSWGTIPNKLESVRKLVGRLKETDKLKCCYQAGPTGYVLYWQLTQLGVDCEVIASSLIPTKAGDRVKTDRRDAEKLARCYRAGELTAVWVPDADHEALRDLVRAREAAKQDQLRHRHQLGKFLLRHGKRPVEAGPAWSAKYLNWIKIHVRFEQAALEATLADYLHEVEHAAERIVRLEQSIEEAVRQAAPQVRAVIEALQALRGVAHITAATVVAEVNSLARFESPRQLMGYCGLAPREYSSGKSHLSRRDHQNRQCASPPGVGGVGLGVPARPAVNGRLLKRQRSLTLSDETKHIAWKAQQRLHKRYTAMMARGKHKHQVITALARELLGFLWAIAVHAEAQFKAQKTA
jgi:transposase